MIDERTVRERLRRFVQTEILNDSGPPIADDELLLSSGRIDSLALAEIAVFVEREFGVDLPVVSITEQGMDSVARIASLVVRHGAQE